MFNQTQAIESNIEKVTINSHCSICKTKIKIIARRPNVCKNCKTNLAYIARNHQHSATKLNNLKIRLVALTSIRNDPKIGVTEALRKAINYINSTTVNQAK